jgi:hypothetical protein
MSLGVAGVVSSTVRPRMPPVKLGALCRRSRRGREQRLRLQPHALDLSLMYMGAGVDSPAKLAGVMSRAQH